MKTTLDLSLKLVTALTLVGVMVSTAQPAAAVDEFGDDNGSVHETAINALAAAGITLGCNPPTNTNYCPNNPVTRAQMATFLVRALDLPLAYDLVVSPGADLQALVNTNGAGTTFLLTSGVYRQQTVYPKDGMVFVGQPGAVMSGARLLTDFVTDGGRWVASNQAQQGGTGGECVDGYSGCVFPEDVFIDGEMLWQVTELADVAPDTWYFDYAADKIYLGQDPAGHVVETSISDRAFSGSTQGVRIRGLTIEKYANKAQLGAIDGWNADGWLVEYNEIRLNHGTGIKFGERFSFIGNHVHHQGQLGVGGKGADVTITGNEISFNNVAGFAMGWEGGGSKFVSTTNLVVTFNSVHDNIGTGLWTDGNNLDTVFAENVSSDNASHGIHHEISYAAEIRDNVLARNGGYGVKVSSAPDVHVVGNLIDDNAQGGVWAQHVDRGSGGQGPYVLENLLVERNEIIMTTGLTGLRQYVGDDSYFTSRNNEFDYNTYELGESGPYYEWMNGQVSATDWVAFGNDVNGTWR